jgi:cyclase
VSPIDLAIALEEAGAGEIVINSVDRDGTMDGYDYELATACRSRLHVPLTVLGGAGSLEDIGEMIARCGTVGTSAGSLFVFKGPRRAVLINYPDSDRKDEICGRGMLRYRETQLGVPE